MADVTMIDEIEDARGWGCPHAPACSRPEECGAKSAQAGIASPAWMQTQAPKATITKVDGAGDIQGEGGTLATLPTKTRKPRRTKAQMLADAAARAEKEGKIGYASAGPTPSMVDVEFIHPDMAREDTAHAVAIDLHGARAVGLDSGRTFSKVQKMYVPTTTTDRLAIVACLLALLALSVAIVALAR